VEERPFVPQGMIKKPNKTAKKSSKFLVSTFNAQSISNDSYLIEFENALKQIQYDVIGLSEVKRIGEGRMDMNGYIFFYSGKERRRGTVGFIVNSKWKNNIQAFKSYSDRIITLQMTFKSGSLGLIQAYAPTSSSSEQEIKSFYDQLSIAVTEMERNTWLIVLGDFNAKIGQSNGNESEVVGSFGLGQRNERSEMLIDFARSRELFISIQKTPKQEMDLAFR
jgi:exonuclease III